MYYTAIACYYKKYKRNTHCTKKKTVAKKKHTYYLFVFFLTVHLVFHTSHEVPF